MALRDATVEIAKGRFVAIVGPSGSGKTTLLSILGLLDRPTSGTYWLAGREAALLDERERDRVRGTLLGFVFQNSYLVASETVGRTVSLGLRVRGVARRERDSRITAALDQVGLASMAGKRAGELSGGEKQRVAVARALVTAPHVILADEPTGALDGEATTRLIMLLRQISDEGTTVIVVSHDPLVAAAADEVLQIEDGTIRPREAALG